MLDLGSGGKLAFANLLECKSLSPDSSVLQFFSSSVDTSHGTLPFTAGVSRQTEVSSSPVAGPDRKTRHHGTHQQTTENEQSRTANSSQQQSSEKKSSCKSQYG
mgnify:CR=1 FL=1